MTKLFFFLNLTVFDLIILNFNLNANILVINECIYIQYAFNGNYYESN